MSYKGIYIDDNPNDLDYADLLEVSGEDGVNYQKLQPQSLNKFAQTIIEQAPDVIALDYRLDEDHKNNSDNDYRAGTLAQQLREILVEQPDKDFPIILVSTEENIRKFFQPDKTAHDLFDEWYRKKTISNHSEMVGTQILSLINGYKRLSKCVLEETDPLSLLNLSDDESFVIEDTNLDVEVEGVKTVHVLARTLLIDVVKRPGILLRPEDVYARLGIKLDDYRDVVEDIWTVLEKKQLCYDGVFCKGWPRVWKHRLEFWLKDSLGQSITGMPTEERVKEVNKLFGMQCSPAPSRWTKKTDEFPSFACASCYHPTEMKNSVAAYDPRLPKHLEKKRICFDCIETERYERLGLRISSEDKQLVEKIKREELARE